MRLGNTVGDRINEFDNLEIQTVETFNKLFPECPIKNHCPLSAVEILSPTTNNCRLLKLNGEETITHKMFSDILYNVDRDVYNTEEDDELDEMYGIPV